MISIEKGSLTAAFLRCMKFIDISKRAKTYKVPLPNACFSMIDRPSADVKLGADFRLTHPVHVAGQNGKFQFGNLQCFQKYIIFAVIGLPMFKAVYGIHRE